MPPFEEERAYCFAHVGQSWVADGPYCFLGHMAKVKVTGVKCAKPVSGQKLENVLTYLPKTRFTHPSWVA